MQPDPQRQNYLPLPLVQDVNSAPSDAQEGWKSM
jgi:hypothetical protein